MYNLQNSIYYTVKNFLEKADAISSSILHAEIYSRCFHFKMLVQLLSAASSLPKAIHLVASKCAELLEIMGLGMLKTILRCYYLHSALNNTHYTYLQYY